MIKEYLQKKKWVITWAIIFFLVTLVPYVIGFAIQGDSWRFNGFVFGVEDGNSYIAKMLSGANGDWLFRTPYSAAEQKGILAFLPYLLLGKLTSQPAQHEQLIALFQLFRLVGILLACMAADDFLKLYIEDVRLRNLGLILMSVGGGLGWLAVFGFKGAGYNGLPIDLYSPETFGFLSLLGLPHLAVSRALLFWGWVVFLKPTEKLSPVKQGLLIGILWLVMGFFQPLSIVTAWAGMGIAWVVALVFQSIHVRGLKSALLGEPIKNSLVRAILAGLVSAPWVVYNMLAMSLDPFLKGWTAQNIILSPPVWDYLAGFSLVLIPAGFGIATLIRSRDLKGALHLGFTLIFPILAYLPFNLQRRLPDGIWWVLICLAMIGLEKIPARWAKPLRVVMLAGTLSSVFLLIGSFFAVLNPVESVFTPTDKVTAFEQISQDWQGPGKPIVLAAYLTSNELPAWIPATVLIGHGPESVNLATIQPEVEAILMADHLSAEQVQFFRDSKVNYVIFEDGLIPTWAVNTGKILFQGNEVAVLRLGAQAVK